MRPRVIGDPRAKLCALRSPGIATGPARSATLAAPVSAAPHDAFFALTPERVLDAVEVGGRRATGYAFALNSFENRVYEVELEDGERLVAKFYRPDRWSREAIADEHAFLAELHAEELPVVPPIDLGGGETLGTVGDDSGGILYACFPKVRGRPPEDLDEAQLRRIGRLIARLHLVGGRRAAAARPRLTVDYYGTASLRLLLESDFIPDSLRPRYAGIAERVIGECEAAFLRFPDLETLRIHGDCHLGNLLWGKDGPFFLDFDDFLAGPAVQDLWLIAPGLDDEARRQRLALVEGYEEMRAFDRRTLALVEPLRALRILRYAAWIAQRYRDPAFQRAFPDFEEPNYWLREIRALQDQSLRLAAHDPGDDSPSLN